LMLNGVAFVIFVSEKLLVFRLQKIHLMVEHRL